MLVTGRVTDDKGEPVAFANVWVENTQLGTAANEEGNFSIQLAPGEHILVFRAVGYLMQQKKITLNSDPVTLQVTLPENKLELPEIVKKAGAEDPAYAIIRKTIARKDELNKEVKGYQCQVYIKGIQKLKYLPDRIMGVEVDKKQLGSLGVDSTGKGIVYLSESVSDYYFKQPDHIKEIMRSSKVSGKNNAFSYNQTGDLLFDFTDNLIKNNVHPRGLVSPLARNAFLFYRYRLLGAYYENGYLINKIAVMPKRSNDPVFQGTVYIVENLWRIHSLDLFVTKNAGIELIDTLRITQDFSPVQDSTWLLRANRFDFSAAVLGIGFGGYYISNFSGYVLNPAIVDQKRFFGNELLTIQPDANQKDSLYWEKIRPMPLTAEEKKDYVAKDSIRIIYTSPAYLDSIEAVKNRISVQKILLGGYTYRKRAKGYELSFDPLISFVQYNTVEGVALTATARYLKSKSAQSWYTIAPFVRYGIGNGHLNGKVETAFMFNRKKFSQLLLSGGKYISQYNEQEPISPVLNTSYVLLDGSNYLKIYEKLFLKAAYETELLNGWMVDGSAEWAQRDPLENTSFYSFVSAKNRKFTSNDPQPGDFEANLPTQHRAMIVQLGTHFTFGQKYSNRPDQKIVYGSRWPDFNIRYRAGIAMPGASDVQFQELRIGAKDEISLGLLGTSSYEVSAGKFLQAASLYFQDARHFNANLTLQRKPELAAFSLLDYYRYSSSSQYLEVHYEHNFGGFFLNKIPLIRKSGFREVFGFHYLTNERLPYHYEWVAGIDNIGISGFLPGLLRIDIVTAVTSGYKPVVGYRIGTRF